MEQAKQAVKEFLSKSGHHDTTVHERVAPAVTHETITKTEHEELITAIDKEIHQDHFHTSVQPINDESILDEQHHFNLVAVEHRSFEHDDENEVKRRLSEEAAKFKDELVHVEGKHTNAVLPVVAGEHIHHHVHETIQPIVHRQVIEPHIIHTTVPIHEVHHNAAQHHATSALPAVSLADFKRQGGVLTGREERYDGFEGEPRSVGKALGGNNSRPTSSQTGASGPNGNSTDQPASTTAAPTTAAKTAATDAAPARTGSAKPSLLDRINPMKDADGDGRKGIMS
ncbi:hypothetical protein M409DRAFT_66958 [Zasmidium cellare ATCC 36951]|uniref:Allergen n=1 Tax=Zasmidium cellare ATCC 36951 TaxID=1080233 RepID=A0A6A6CFT8_ZASCE|nr:uncharacterized protein M409DRAFT_66958 [Zasmidium cellare ATCC 36951]KAF2166074.1 hypothetical protein M409DRAFT_66958 [Zasmidium cellare ATCC 36951]